MNEKNEKESLSRRNFLVGAGLLGAAAATAGLAGCGPQGSPASDSGGSTGGGGGGAGVYTGVGRGRHGAIVVKVEVDGETIKNIDVVHAAETPQVGQAVIEQYPQLMVENNSINVDTITSATISAMGFKEAVSDALTVAGLDPTDFQTPVALPAPESGDTSCDVVVIGSGGAGLTAATKAAKAGKKVILLEKQGVLGGTSNFSIEGYGAVGDRAHVAVGSPSTPQTQIDAYMKNYPNGTLESYTAFANNNGAQLDWLRSIGAEFTVCGSPVSAATSREVGPIGVTIVAALIAEAKKSGVDIRLNTPATEIVMEEGRVSAIKASNAGGDFTITTKAAIITSGGFGANLDMVVEQQPSLQGYNYSCAAGSTGDMHKAAEAAGAALLNMDYIRVNFCYMTGELGCVYYVASPLNTGAVFMDPDGKRFVSEQSGYGQGLQIVEHGGEGFAVFDSSVMGGCQDVRDYESLGLFVKADTLEELFDAIDINKENALATIETYKGYVAAGADPDFNRPMLNMTFDEPPFYAAPMRCRVQGTFGGIATNERAEVLDAAGAVIPGLYAAGECANDGTWGQNPCSVNIVFGTFAAENAAAYVG
jgi:fumarate reductase flavoprotein subunit